MLFCPLVGLWRWLSAAADSQVVTVRYFVTMFWLCCLICDYLVCVDIRSWLGLYFGIFAFSTQEQVSSKLVSVALVLYTPMTAATPHDSPQDNTREFTETLPEQIPLL